MAARYLEARGYVILERNYRFRRAEVDLIAFLQPQGSESRGEVVFIEVKWRQHSGFSPPEAAVDVGKQRRIATAAEAFLRERRLRDYPCRFDVLAIQGSGAHLAIEHFESAFHV